MHALCDCLSTNPSTRPLHNPTGFCALGITYLSLTVPRAVPFQVVFYITAAASIFAYVWLLFILLISSPNIVEPWEGFVTCAALSIPRPLWLCG